MKIFKFYAMQYKEEVKKIRDEFYKRIIYLSIFFFSVIIITSFGYKLFSLDSQYIADYYIFILSSVVVISIILLTATLYLTIKYLCPKCHSCWAYKGVKEIVVGIAIKRIKIPYSDKEFLYMKQQCIVEFKCYNCLHTDSMLKTYLSSEI